MEDEGEAETETTATAVTARMRLLNCISNTNCSSCEDLPRSGGEGE